MPRTKHIRHPRNKVAAIKNDARPGSIPPDAWECIANKRYNHLWKVAEKILSKKIPINQFIEKMRRQFPTYTKDELRLVYYEVFRVRHNKAEWEKSMYVPRISS